MQPIIDHAGEADLPDILRLYAVLHPHDPPLDPSTALEIWRETLADPKLRVLVARVDGAVSTCTLVTVPNLTRGGRPYALVENVVTLPEHRGRGFGTAVLKHAMALAWNQGCYKVMLMTSRKDEALFRFYEAAGFTRRDKSAFVVRPVSPQATSSTIE